MKSRHHTQHVRLPALHNAAPWRQVLEGRHGEALGAREGDEGQAVLGRRAEAAAAGQVKDHTLLDGQALRLVHGEGEASDDGELRAREPRTPLTATIGKIGAHSGSSG